MDEVLESSMCCYDTKWCLVWICKSKSLAVVLVFWRNIDNGMYLWFQCVRERDRDRGGKRESKLKE